MKTKGSNDCGKVRFASSLIELLVVLAIIGTLMGISLSAVSRIRQSASAISCNNRQRQLALALSNHHDTLYRYPPGHRTTSYLVELMPYSGWTISVLPYLEQTAVCDQAREDYRRRLLPWGKVPHRGISVPISAFQCPADPRVRTAQITHRTKVFAAFTSYLGVAGQNRLANDGILYRNSRTRMAEISDGASNTLLLGERPPSSDLQFGWWYAGLGQRNSGTAEMTLSVREANRQTIRSGSPCGPGVYHFTPADGFSDPCGMFHFWSPHPGGAHFAFADGSVRFLRYSADDILPALATRAGNESVTQAY